MPMFNSLGSAFLYFQRSPNIDMSSGLTIHKMPITIKMIPSKILNAFPLFYLFYHIIASENKKKKAFNQHLSFVIVLL